MVYHGLLWVRYLARPASQPRPHTSKAWAAVDTGLGIPNAGYVHPVWVKPAPREFHSRSPCFILNFTKVSSAGPLPRLQNMPKN